MAPSFELLSSPSSLSTEVAVKVVATVSGEKIGTPGGRTVANITRILLGNQNLLVGYG